MTGAEPIYKCFEGNSYLTLIFADRDNEGDLDVEEIELDRITCRLNLFPQMDSKGRVGSVHTSAVRLRATESAIEEENTEDYEVYFQPKTKRRLHSSRISMTICGGQAYNPTLKSNTLIEQRQHLEKLGHLPLLVQRILTSSQGSFDQDKSKLTLEVISKFDTLEALLQNMADEWKNSGKNIVRFEFFVTSNLHNHSCDIFLPVPDPRYLITVVDHQAFKRHWAGYNDVYKKPLAQFVGDLRKCVTGSSLLNPAEIIPEIRTCLVLCAEKCVEAANIIGFRGRIIQSIWNELSHIRYGKDFFVLPSTVLVSVDDTTMHRYALHRPVLASAGAIPSHIDQSAPTGQEEEEVNGMYPGPYIQFFQVGATTPSSSLTQ